MERGAVLKSLDVVGREGPRLWILQMAKILQGTLETVEKLRRRGDSRLPTERWGLSKTDPGTWGPKKDASCKKLTEGGKMGSGESPSGSTCLK